MGGRDRPKTDIDIEITVKAKEILFGCKQAPGGKMT
jgi:hypothetical protein